jgi:hypothetical protein
MATTRDQLQFLRTWVRDHANLAFKGDRKAVEAFDNLMYSASILAAEIDSDGAGQADADDDDRRTLADAMEVGRAAAEVEPLVETEA